MLETLTVRGTTYEVDWDLVGQIVRQYHLSHYQISLSRVTSSKDSQWYNPASWQMPTVVNVDTPWDDVRTKAAVATAMDLKRYRTNASNDIEAIRQELVARESGIRANRGSFLEMTRKAQSANSAAFASSEKSYEMSIGAAAFIRDASAGALVLGSTIMTGGAAAAALGAGSVLTGYGTYQDKGSIGAGIISGLGTVVIGSFAISGKVVSGGLKAVLIVAKGGIDTSAGIVAGDSVDDSVADGVTSMVVGGVGCLFDTKMFKGFFRKMPMPVKITAPRNLRATGYLTKSLGREFVADFLNTGTQATAKAGIDKLREAIKNTSGGACYGSVAGEAVFESLDRVDKAIHRVAVGR